MEYILDKNILTIKISGNIDTNTSLEIEKQIFDITTANSHEKLVLDFDDVNYVSSAGLRVILKVKKLESTAEIINVNRDVYDVFEMTGFVEIMPIKKALRKLDLGDAVEIGRGANGAVYRYKDDMIVKVYYNPKVTLEEIKNEITLAKKAFVSGIPTAIPFDIVKVGQYYGSVFELINAKSLAELISENPDNLEGYVKDFIDFVKNIHAISIDDDSVPSIKDNAKKWFNFATDFLDEERKEKLINIINELPYSNTMLHGDYHIKNVMIQNDEMILIDMDTVCKGEILFELSAMYNAFVAFNEVVPEDIPQFLSVPQATSRKIWELSLKYYFSDKDEDFRRSVERKVQVVSYVRLMRITRNRKGDSIEGKKEFAHYQKQLIEALDNVDTLKIEA